MKYFICGALIFGTIIFNDAHATGTTPEKDYSSGIIPFSESTGAVDLGMNGVPVLDQGSEGTCVTFSTTAAVDAVLGYGDFISQQCSLELGVALGAYEWEGAILAAQIIEPLKTFGIVQQGNCNATYPNPWAFISISDYMARASTTVTAANISYNYYIHPSLDSIKAMLNKGHRVTIGFIMPGTNDQISVDGFDMTINGQKTTGGLWACEQPSSFRNYCILPTAGHDTIVIGYDDNQELLKIRNSWGTNVGDNGDFYMTYYYYNATVETGTEIY